MCDALSRNLPKPLAVIVGHCLAHALSPEARLVYHQTHSAPVLADLHAWLTAQLADHLVEPNSSLGQAITYLLNHWMLCVPHRILRAEFRDVHPPPGDTAPSG
jgi:hypothetical protein